MPFTPDTPAQGSSFKPDNPVQPQNFEANSTTASTSPNAQAPQEGVLSKFWDILKNGDARTAAKLKQMGYNAPATGMDDPAYTDLVGMTGPENIVGIGKGLANAARGITSLGQDAVSGIREFLRPAAERADLADIAGRFGSKVKDPLAFQQYAEDAADAAKQQLNARQVAPRMAIQNSIADGKSIPIDVSQIQGLHPDVDALIKNAQNAYAGQAARDAAIPRLEVPSQPPGQLNMPLPNTEAGAPKYITKAIPEFKQPDLVPKGTQLELPDQTDEQLSMLLPEKTHVPPSSITMRDMPHLTQPEQIPSGSQLDMGDLGNQNAPQLVQGVPQRPPEIINIPAKDAIKIRQAINTITPSFQDPTVKTKLLNAGNYIRSQLSQLDPAMSDLSQGMQDAYSTQSSVFGPRGNKSALSAITAPDTVTGVNKAANLQNFDQQAGSDLSGLGDNIKSVLDRKKVLSLKGLEGFLHPLQFIKEGVEIPLRSGQNAYDSLARGAYNTLSNPSDAGNLYNFLQLSNKKVNRGK